MILEIIRLQQRFNAYGRDALPGELAALETVPSHAPFRLLLARSGFLFRPVTIVPSRRFVLAVRRMRRAWKSQRWLASGFVLAQRFRGFNVGIRLKTESGLLFRPMGTVPSARVAPLSRDEWPATRSGARASCHRKVQQPYHGHHLG